MTPCIDAGPRILAVLTVRNEAPFLVDWLAHHRAAGVTDVIAVSNDCDDGTDAMLDRLQAMGWVTHLRNPGPHPKGPQWSALALADRERRTIPADWIIGLDIDEFINVRLGGHRLPDLIAHLPGATAITLSWRFFGNDGILGPLAAPVPDSFRMCAPSVMAWPWRAAQFKTLFRNDGSYGRLGVHRPRQPAGDRIAGQAWFDGAGRRLPPRFHRQGVFLPPGPDRHTLVQLNHYALGSALDYILKCDRGRANRDARPLDMAYWIERNFNTDRDDSIESLGPARRRLAQGLRADPAIAAFEQAATVWRKARLAQLFRQEAWRDHLVRLLMAGPSVQPDGQRAAFLARLFSSAQQIPPIDKIHEA